MTSLKNAKDVYNLIAKILELTEQDNNEVFKNALIHVENNYKGSDRSSLIKILNNLENLYLININKNVIDNINRKYDDTNFKKKRKFDLSFEPKSFHNELNNDSIIQNYVRELNAILYDNNFLPNKNDLAFFIKKYFKDTVNLRDDNRESRRDICRKAISAFKRMNNEEKDQIFKVIRNIYLKERKSELADWSNIISNGGSK